MIFLCCGSWLTVPWRHLVFISYKTPLHRSAFQVLLNWGRFNPKDENLNCNVSSRISFHQREDSEAQWLWHDLEDKSTPTTHCKPQQLDYGQPNMHSQLLLEQVRWVPTSSSSTWGKSLTTRTCFVSLLKRTSYLRENLLGPLPVFPQQMPKLLLSRIPQTDTFPQEWSLNFI